MVRVILFISIVQVVLGTVVLGLSIGGYEYTRRHTGDELADKTPLIVTWAIIISGLIGILADTCEGDCLQVMYLMCTSFATAASAAMTWISVDLYLKKCVDRGDLLACDGKLRNLVISNLSFSAGCLIISLIGLALVFRKIKNRMAAYTPE